MNATVSSSDNMDTSLGNLEKIPYEMREEIYALLLKEGHLNILTTSKEVYAETIGLIFKYGIFRITDSYPLYFDLIDFPISTINSIENVSIELKIGTMPTPTLSSVLALLARWGRNGRKSCTVNVKWMFTSGRHPGGYPTAIDIVLTTVQSQPLGRLCRALASASGFGSLRYCIDGLCYDSKVPGSEPTALSQDALEFMYQEARKILEPGLGVGIFVEATEDKTTPYLSFQPLRYQKKHPYPRRRRGIQGWTFREVSTIEEAL